MRQEKQPYGIWIQPLANQEQRCFNNSRYPSESLLFIRDNRQVERDVNTHQQPEAESAQSDSDSHMRQL